MKKVKASKNKAATVETPNIELGTMSSEDLGLLMQQQCMMLMQAKDNIAAITQTLEKRKAKTDE